MRPLLHPRLINGPFGDPVLLISFLFENRSILFDLGDISSLSSKDILKTSHVFVSHTHMDHFSGFDRLLRLFLGRNKTLYLYGPEGIIQNVEGKLAGYTWNLVDHYKNSFSLIIIEIHSDRSFSRSYFCQNRFSSDEPIIEKPIQSVLVEGPSWTITAAILDHGIPSLAFSIEERFHVNIRKDRIKDMGLEVGPWITAFKQSLYSGKDPDSVFQVIIHNHPDLGKTYILGKLSQEIASISPGQKITYITDTLYSPENIEKIIDLAKKSDYLFIESAFLEADRHIAGKKHHLTAWQAGTLAAMAQVSQFTTFHYSPRYKDQEELLMAEAQMAYDELICQ